MATQGNKQTNSSKGTMNSSQGSQAGRTQTGTPAQQPQQGNKGSKQQDDVSSRRAKTNLQDEE